MLRPQAPPLYEATKPKTCECSDVGCVRDHGSTPCGRASVVRMHRIDYEGDEGWLFCQECAEDASETGLFVENKR